MFTASWNLAGEPGQEIGTYISCEGTTAQDLNAINSKGTINLKGSLIHSLQT